MNTNQSFPKELAAVMLRGTPVVPGLAFGPSIHVLLHGRAEAAVPAPAVAARPQLLRQFADLFAKMGGLMAERVADLRDIETRLVARIVGAPEPGLVMPSVRGGRSRAALAVVLLGLGITSLSMGPSAVRAVGARLGQVSLDQCRRAADVALAATSPAAARDAGPRGAG